MPGLVAPGLALPPGGDGGGGSAGAGTAKIEWHEDTVQLLKGIGTNDGLLLGDLGVVDGTGAIYRAVAVAATSSTWHPSSGEWDVRDFGASTGAADSLTEINAAITECFDEQIGQVRVTGIFTVSGPVIMLSGVSIVGHGEVESGFRGASLADGVLSDNAAAVRNLRVERILLDNTSRAAVGGRGVKMTGGGSRIVFEQVRVKNAEKGYEFSGITLVTLTKCHGTTISTGVSAVAGANEVNAFACVMNDVDTRGYELDAVSNCTFLECAVQGLTAGFGYHVANAANNNSIVRPRIENAAATGQVGVRIDDATCTSNYIERVFSSNITTVKQDAGTRTTHLEVGALGMGVDPSAAAVNANNGVFGTLSGTQGGISAFASSQVAFVAGENDGAGGVANSEAGKFYYDLGSNSWRMDIEGNAKFIWRDNGSGTVWFAPLGGDGDAQLGLASARWGKTWAWGFAFRVEPDAATINLDAKTGVEVDSSGAARTLNLPALSGVNQEGQLYIIAVVAIGNPITLTAASGDNINGSGATRSLASVGQYIVWSSGDGSRWHAFGPQTAL